MSPMHWLLLGVLPAARAVGFVALLPTLGSTLSSWQVRAALAVVLTLLLAPARMPAGGSSSGEPSISVTACVAELSAGLLVGFGVRAVWTALAWSAELIAQQAGLAGGQSAEDDLPESPLARLYGLVALAVLFAGGGHRAIVAALLAEPVHAAAGGEQLAEMASGMLAAASTLALRVAAPAALAVFSGTLATAMAVRAVPRLVLNQATVPAQLLLVLVAAAAGISALPAVVHIAVTWFERFV